MVHQGVINGSWFIQIIIKQAFVPYVFLDMQQFVCVFFGPPITCQSNRAQKTLICATLHD